MTPSDACATFIMREEGCARKLPDGRFAAYPDPGTGGKPWTIGFGSTGPDIRPGTIWTLDQCEERFRADLAEFGDQVSRIIGTAKTTQGQFDAMVSFAYNVGVGNLASSTLLKKHEAADYAGAAAQFARWTKAGNRVLPGLVARRAAEAKLYLGGKA